MNPRKSTIIRVIDGAGRSKACTVPGRDECLEPPTNRIQYVYPYTTVSFGACVKHANRHERRAPIQESAP